MYKVYDRKKVATLFEANLLGEMMLRKKINTVKRSERFSVPLSYDFVKLYFKGVFYDL